MPPGLHILQTALVLWASGAMLLLEFLADKVPLVDSVWDALHTVIRIPAGAALAAGVFTGPLGGDHASWALVAALAGGTLAAAAHTTKATTRAAVNTSPEPLSNLGVSLLEDGLVVAALWLAVEYPMAFFVGLAAALVLSGLLVVWLWRFLGALLRRLRGWAGGAEGDSRCSARS